MKYKPSFSTKPTGASLTPLAIRYQEAVKEEYIDKMASLTASLSKGLKAGGTYEGVSYPSNPIGLLQIYRKHMLRGKSKRFYILSQQRLYTGRSSQYMLEVVQGWEKNKTQPTAKIISQKGRKAKVELTSGYVISKDASLYQAIALGVKHPSPLPQIESNLARILYSEYKSNMLRPLLVPGSKLFLSNLDKKLKQIT